MYKDMDYFFAMYEKYDMANIIQTQSTENELNAWKQFLYGQDRYGHPIVYDLVGCGNCKQLLSTFNDPKLPFGEKCYRHVLRFMRKLENYKGFTTGHLKGNN